MYSNFGKACLLWLLLQGSLKPPVATTIFFGANDAALSGRTSERQYVPLEEFEENLRKIVHHLKVQHPSLTTTIC